MRPLSKIARMFRYRLRALHSPHALPRRAFRSRILSVLLLAASTGAAHADDAMATPANLRLNGFGTLGIADVLPHDSWGFRRDVDQAAHHDQHLRADIDSRLGLQASWRPDARFELVGQVVLKPRAHEAAGDESLAWAFAAWRPTPEWEVRMGRTSPDLFLLADVRNVGFAYPWVRPNVEFYGWMPPSSLDGVDLSRQWQWDGARLRAKVFGGRTSVTLASTHDDGDTHGNIRPLVGGTLALDSGSLTIKATVAQARTRARDPGAVAASWDGLDQLARLPVPVVAMQAARLRDSFPRGDFITRYAALGLVWDSQPWQLQAEASRITGNFDTSQSWYGYLSAARRIDEVTLFGVAGLARTSRAPLPDPQWSAALAPLVGPALAGQAQALGQAIASSYNLARQDQRSFSLGARWDCNAQVALKLQADRIHSKAFGGGLWAYDTRAAHRATVVSASMDFVF